MFQDEDLYESTSGENLVQKKCLWTFRLKTSKKARRAGDGTRACASVSLLVLDCTSSVLPARRCCLGKREGRHTYYKGSAALPLNTTKGSAARPFNTTRDLLSPFFKYYKGSAALPLNTTKGCPALSF